MKLRFASPHFVYSSPRVFWLELYCFGAKNLSLKKPIRNGRSFALLCKRPGAVIKQITLNNLPWQPSNVGKKKKKDSEDWCKKNKIKKTVVEMRRNTKWEEGDLREEVLQGSIYTYPRRAGAAGGDSGVSSPGPGHSCLVFLFYQTGTKWIRSRSCTDR